LALDHEIEVDCPAWMLFGAAVKLVIVAGCGGATTLIATELSPLAPPAPEHTRLYV
jgi:hypothetical protein